MEFSYSLSSEDYKKVTRRIIWDRSNLKVPLLLFAGAIGGCIIIFREGVTIAIAIYMILVLFALIFIFVLNPVRIGKQVKHNLRLLHQATWNVTDTQIIIKTPASEFCTDWNYFTGYIETGDYLLLKCAENKSWFQIVPKAAFVSIEQEQQFRGYLECKYARDRKFDWKRNRSSIFFLVFIILAIIIILHNR